MRDFLLAFVSIFVALDVMGTLPLYSSMTSDQGEHERKSTVTTSMGVALLVALAFIFGGEALFTQLGITLFDFKIAGGLVLLLISLAELLGNSELESRASGKTGVIPLAVPLITGPAVLTTLLLQITRAGYEVTLLALVVNYAIAWALLYHSSKVTRLIGKDGIAVISKIAALLLAAIAIAMIRGGVFESIRNFRL